MLFFKENFMKSAIILLSAVLGSNVFAASAKCKKMASDRAYSDMAKQVSDDCFQQYVQEARDDKNTFYIGFACDHVGNFQYKFVTRSQGDSCRIVSVQSKAL